MATAQGNWKQRGEHEWRALLARFGWSGLSIADFCRHESISVASFYRWRRLLSDGGASAGAPMPAAPAGDRALPDSGAGFVDLGELMAPPEQASGRLEIRLDLGAGMVLHLVRG